MKNICLFILICCTTFLSCRKDVNSLVVNETEDPPIVLVRSSIQGKVINEAEQPIANAVVTIGNELTTSNANGYFYFNNIKVNKAGGIIKAKVNGHFEGIVHSNFRAAGSSFVEIRMMEKGTAHNFIAGQGSNLITNDNLNITIPPNAIVNQNGSTYNGSVRLYARWLDPTDENIGGIMPGALNATDDDGNPLVLASYGMFVLELESLAGAQLQIKNEMTIKVEMDIPAELLDTAPDNIPLWYYDLEEEQWLEQGSCDKEGNKYICNIKQSGFWNCDVPLEAICLSGQVFNSDSSFSSYLKVIVEDLTDNFIYWGYTDSTGYFCGSVPRAAPLRLIIKDLCDNVVYMKDIGPFSEDFQLEDIYLDVLVETYLINIIGSILHCSSTDVPDGHLAIRYPGNISIYPFVAGALNANLALKCIQFPSLEIQAYSSSQQAVTTTFIHSELADIDLATQQTCEELSDFFKIEVDGVEFWTSPTQFYLDDNTTTDWMVLEGLSGGGKFKLELRDYQGPGQYTSNVFLDTENELASPSYPILNAASPDITVNIVSDDGTFIQGNFSGNALDTNGMSKPVNGDFLIRKAP